MTDEQMAGQMVGQTHGHKRETIIPLITKVNKQ